MDLSLKIDVVDQISAENFRENYLLPQKPLLIKGSLASAQPAGSKWSIDFFKKNYGDLPVEVYDNNNTKTNASAYTKGDMIMPFRDFLEVIEKDEPSSIRMFLFNMFKVRPELRNDFKCPDLFKGILGKMGYMFFGGTNTHVRMHQDIDMSNVLLTQFKGRKRVVLFSPEYSHHMYCLPLNTYSLIDFNNPDYKKYPALKYAKGYELIMDEGDSLYMPSGYWHFMTYLGGGFAVSYRKIGSNLKWKIQAILNLAVYLPFDKLMNFILGNMWLNYKQRVAEKRAQRIIKENKNNPGVMYKKELQLT